jgi:hypothetical protein
MSDRKPGLYVIFDDGPGPVAGRFVELEDENGRSVGPKGVEWTQEGDLWLLGPLVPVEPDDARA